MNDMQLSELRLYARTHTHTTSEAQSGYKPVEDLTKVDIPKMLERSGVDLEDLYLSGVFDGKIVLARQLLELEGSDRGCSNN